MLRTLWRARRARALVGCARGGSAGPVSGRPATGRFSRRSFFFTGDVPAGIDAMFSRSLLFGCCGASRAQPANFLFFVVFLFLVQNVVFSPLGASASMGLPKYCPAGSCALCRRTIIFQNMVFFYPARLFFLLAAVSLFGIGKFVLQLIPARSIWENRRPTPVGQWPRIKEKRKTRERGKNRRDDLQVKKIKKKKIVQEGLRVKNNIRAG